MARTKAKALRAPKGIARGLNKGHVVTKRKLVGGPVSAKGVSSFIHFDFLICYGFTSSFVTF